MEKLRKECEYLTEYLEDSYSIVKYAIDIAENILYEKSKNLCNEYNSKFFIETILFSLDDIKNSLKNHIGTLQSLDFNTLMNESYQIYQTRKRTADIIPFYRENDCYVYSDINISEIFQKKPENFLKLIKNNENSSENHDK